MKNYTTPYFSVIIPTYNRNKFVGLAIESVLNQTYRDLELIIIDDGSSDGTNNIVSNFADKRIKYVYQKNKGVSYARNRGLELSKGKYITFLDSDDRWIPEKLAKTFKYIQQFPDIRIFHTEEIWYRKGKILNQKKKHKKPEGYVYFNSLALCCISISTAAVRKEVFNDIGVFDESMPACEDYDFWLRATHKLLVKLIPEYLTIKDGGRPDQLSTQHSLDKYRIISLQKMLKSKILDNQQYEKTRQELVRKCTIFSKGAERRGKIQEAEYYYNITCRY